MRIMIADDQSRVRFALRMLLERQPGIQIGGETADAAQLLASTRQVRPDLVLLDSELPGATLSRLLAELRKACPGVSVIALSGRPEGRTRALAAGVDDFVSKSDPPELLLAAIEECGSGQRGHGVRDRT